MINNIQFNTPYQFNQAKTKRCSIQQPLTNNPESQISFKGGVKPISVKKGFLSILNKLQQKPEVPVYNYDNADSTIIKSILEKVQVKEMQARNLRHMAFSDKYTRAERSETFIKAEQSFLEILGQKRSILKGKDAIKLTSTTNETANLYYRKNKLKPAKHLFQDTLEIYRKTQDFTDTHDLLYAIDKLVNIFDKTENYKGKAKLFYEWAPVLEKLDIDPLKAFAGSTHTERVFNK